MAKPLAVIVLAAGLGTRTGVDMPKVLLPLCGQTLLGTVLNTVSMLRPDRTVVVLHHGKDRVEKTLEGIEGIETVDQGHPCGTGHAVMAAMGKLGAFDGDVLIVYGDVPLITTTTLNDLRIFKGSASAIVLTAFASPPEGLGRILRDGEGKVLGIREQRDCSAEELEIEEFNAGIYCFDGNLLPAALNSLSADNDQSEYYLTDAIEWFLEQGHAVDTRVLESADEVLGINNLTELSYARSLLQEQILVEHMQNGVIIEDPATTFIDQDVTIGRNTQILPCTVICRGVNIGTDCQIGPFSHLRVGTVLDEAAKVGNFVETKETFVGKGTKASHLTYLGDCTIGEGVNIGAGTITANYDGVNKHATIIGDGSFVGSGTVLVAPGRMGAKSMTGAGAIVTKNFSIPAGDVFVGVPARSLKEKQANAKAAAAAGEDTGASTEGIDA